MKKILAVVLAAILCMSFAACGNGAQSGGNADISDSLELLTAVWDAYGDDEKFSAVGGDLTEENMTTDAPGRYGLDDAMALDSALGLPESSLDKVDDAASLIHMINANTFTCGVFHAKSSSDVDALAGELKDNILARHWMCGFPDKLVIASVGDYVISVFGHEELLDTFKDKLATAYPDAEIISEDSIF